MIIELPRPGDVVFYYALSWSDSVMKKTVILHLGGGWWLRQDGQVFEHELAHYSELAGGTYVGPKYRVEIVE